MAECKNEKSISLTLPENEEAPATKTSNTRISRFKCTKCKFSTTTASRLKTHRIVHKPKNIKCNKCDMTFKHNTNLRNHQRNIHSGRARFWCRRKCHFVSKTIEELKQHTALKHPGYKCDNNEDEVQTGSSWFKCRHRCHFASKIHEELKRHIAIKHSFLKCDKCDFITRARYPKAVMLTHQLTHLKEKPYKCDLCDYTCVVEFYLAGHRKRMHPTEKLFKCNRCNFVTKTYPDLQIHKQIHSYKCPECEFTSVRPYDLQLHQQETHSGQRLKCKYDQCPGTFPSNAALNLHVERIHIAGEENECLECGFVCVQSIYFTNHKCTAASRRKMSCRKLFKCNECDYSSGKKYLLAKHVIIHKNGEKPYKCDLCDYRAIRSTNLVYHLKKVHGTQHPFKCDQCDFTAVVQSKILEHKRTHTGEKPFPCDQCNFSTSQAKRLTNHQFKHSGIKPYKCDECDYSCIKSERLIAHKRLHTGEKPYKCTKCKSAFFNNGQLSYHKTRCSSTNQKVSANAGKPRSVQIERVKIPSRKNQVLSSQKGPTTLNGGFRKGLLSITDMKPCSVRIERLSVANMQKSLSKSKVVVKAEVVLNERNSTDDEQRQVGFDDVSLQLNVELVRNFKKEIYGNYELPVCVISVKKEPIDEV